MSNFIHRIDLLDRIQADCTALAAADDEAVRMARVRAERVWELIRDGMETPQAILLIMAWWAKEIREQLEASQ